MIKWNKFSRAYGRPHVFGSSSHWFFESLFSFSHKHLKSSSSTVLFNYFSICDWTWIFRHRSFKKLFILIRTLCSFTCKGSFPSHPQGQLSAAAILLPCFCSFIYSFLCRHRSLDCVPVAKKTFPKAHFKTTDVQTAALYTVP